MPLHFGLRLPSGALVAGETTTPVTNLAKFSSAEINLNITTLTLPDADDEVDFFIQVSYDGGGNWTDVQNVHFTNADDGATRLVPIVIDGAKDGPGTIQARTGVNPPAATDIVETVPANTLSKVRSIRFSFVTDANAANRGVLIQLNNVAGGIYHHTRQHDVQIASLTRRYNYSVGTYYLAAALFDEYHNVLPDLVMAAGHVWRTVTGSMQATDNYGGPEYLVEDWHDPNISTDATMGDNLKSYRRPLGSQIRIRTTVTGATPPTYAYSADMLLRE